MIRDAFDPFGHQARARSRLGDPGREGVDPALMGPHAEEVAWSHYRTDSAFHNTYWISSWPRSEVGPSFLAPLLMQSATVRTVAVTIEPVPFAQAMRQAETAQTPRSPRRWSGAARASSPPPGPPPRPGGHPPRRGARRRLRRDALRRVHHRLGARRRGPRARHGDIEHAGQLARLELQRMYGEQDAAFANTLPLCRGLR